MRNTRNAREDLNKQCKPLKLLFMMRLLFERVSISRQPCGITMETRLRISFLLTYRLTVKLFTLFVEWLRLSMLSALEVVLGILSTGPSGPSACFHLERSVIQTNKQNTCLEGVLIFQTRPVLHTSAVSK